MKDQAWHRWLDCTEPKTTPPMSTLDGQSSRDTSLPDFTKTKRFSYTDEDYNKAKAFLKKIDMYYTFFNNSFLIDGYSLIAYTNELLREHPEYQDKI